MGARTLGGVAAIAAAFAMTTGTALATPAAQDTGDTSVNALAATPRGAQGTMAVSLLDTSYVRFTVAGLKGIPVQRAVLRLWVTDGSISSTDVRTTTDGWSESTMVNRTAPGATSGRVTTVPNTKAGRWAEFDVTSVVPADGTYAFVLQGGLLDPEAFATREGGAATAPQLVVTPMTPAQELALYAADPAHATAHRYGATAGLPAGGSVALDGLKVIEDPRGGGYLGVSHALVGGVFHAYVSRSSDLMSWTVVRDLGAHASQPTIAVMPDRSVLVAYERDAPDPDPTVVNRSQLVFDRYADAGALTGGAAPVQELVPPRTLSPYSEGTPSIRSASFAPDAAHSTVVVDFHYLRQGANGRQDVDRQATGTLSGFTTWTASALPMLDAQFDALGVHGNLGDRDDAVFRGSDVALFEGQSTRGDFGTFRLYAYDRAAGGPPVPLAMTTDGGSTAFGNPTVSVLRAPDGRLALFTSAYVFSEGAAAGEAGEMLALREVPEGT